METRRPTSPLKIHSTRTSLPVDAAPHPPPPRQGLRLGLRQQMGPARRLHL
uniref:Uncharacterized protein n=1 Tax=Arundo donax TaxID=35708 RepID=A0A0A9EVL3_ARUDO